MEFYVTEGPQLLAADNALFLKSASDSFASYAHPPIVKDNAYVHEIGSHIPVVADRYPGISLS